jgi:hypothetical protein
LGFYRILHAGCIQQLINVELARPARRNQFYATTLTQSAPSSVTRRARIRFAWHLFALCCLPGDSEQLGKGCREPQPLSLPPPFFNRLAQLHNARIPAIEG